MAKTDGRDFFEITPEMMQYAALCQEHSEIDSSLAVTSAELTSNQT